MLSVDFLKNAFRTLSKNRKFESDAKTLIVTLQGNMEEEFIKLIDDWCDDRGLRYTKIMQNAYRFKSEQDMLFFLTYWQGKEAL